VLAIDFSTTLTGGTPTVNKKLRWPDQEQAVLSACSSLITIVEDRETRIVHFSHFSVKEFLTSDRLAAAKVDGLRDYHISLQPAHIVMAQACLAVLLCLDASMDRETIENYPLAKYSGDHFGVHAEFDDDVLSHITDGVNDLLNPDKPHFDTWIWLQIGDWNPWSWHNAHLAEDVFSSRHPSRLSLSLYGAPKYPPQVAPLYYVAALGHLRLAQHLKETRPQDLLSKDDKGCAPFHIAVFAGKVKVSELLIGCSDDLDIRDIEGHNLLHRATWKGQIDIARVLLEHDGETKALVNAKDENGQTPLHIASQHNRLSIVALLLEFGANVNVQDNDGMTPLFFAAQSARSSKVVQLLLKHGAEVNRTSKNGQVPLHLASQHVNLSNMELLLKSGATVDARDNDGMTSLLLAAQSTRCGAAAQLLLEHDASFRVRNKNGQTPLHLASRWGLSDVVASLLKLGADVDAQDNDKMTPLLCASGPFRSIAAAQVLLKHGANVRLRNKNGQTPLHVASENHFSNVVALLLESGAEVDAQDDNNMTPLQIALSSPSRSSWQSWSSSSLEDLKKVVELLLEHGANIHFAE
jgi:ankyrin repeat protein